MRVLYYNYYLFYKKIGLDSDPNLAARLALTFLEALFISGIINTLLAYLFCMVLPIYFEFGIVGFFLILNTYIFLTSEKELEIIKSKPMIFNSPQFSIIFSILFFLINVSTLFWLLDYLNSVIKNCH